MSHLHRFLPTCGAKAGLPLVLLAGLGLSAVPPGPGEAEFRLPNPHSAIPSEVQPADGNLEALKAQANAAAMKGDTQEYERIIGTYRQLKGTLITPHSRSHATHQSLVNTATSAQAHEADWSATVSTGSVSQTLNHSATSSSSSVSATPSALTMTTTGSLTATTSASVANGSTGGASSLEQELENLTTGEVSYLPGPAAASSSSAAASLPALPGRPLLTSAGNQAVPLLPDFTLDFRNFTAPAPAASAAAAESSAEAFSGPCELVHAQALANHWNLRVDIFERVPDAQDVNGQTAIRSLHQLNPGKRPNDSRFRLLCQDGHYSLIREARAGEVAQYVLSGTGFVHPEACPLAGQPVFQPVPADENSFIAALFYAVQGELPEPGEIAMIRKDITRNMQAPAASVNAAGSSLAAAQ